MRTQHLLLTRFSVRIKPGGDNPWAYTTDQEIPRDWLEERLRLFRAYCLGSVRGQTCQDFEWLVFCDESTRSAVLDALNELAEDMPQMRLVMTDEFRSSAALPYVDEQADAVITTRLDSDDAIHEDYVAAVQARAGPFASSDAKTELINFPRGYKLDDQSGRVFFHWETRSHFHSLVERPAEAQTVLSHSHSSMHAFHPTVHDDTFPAWVEVVHGGNVSNKLSKTLAPAPAARLEQFNLAAAYARP